MTHTKKCFLLGLQTTTFPSDKVFLIIPKIEFTPKNLGTEQHDYKQAKPFQQHMDHSKQLRGEKQVV